MQEVGSGNVTIRGGEIAFHDREGNTDMLRGGNIVIESGGVLDDGMGTSHISGNVRIMSSSNFVSGGNTGSVTLESGSAGEKSGDVGIFTGSSKLASGSILVGVAPGEKVAQVGGDVRLEAGHTSNDGVAGSIIIKPGKSNSGTPGMVVAMDYTGEERIRIGKTGSVDVTSKRDTNITINAGRTLKIVVPEEGDDDGVLYETKEGKAIFRMKSNEVISHVPIQAAAITYPSDRRIKTNISDVDEYNVLRRLQDLEVRKYHYTAEWRNVRGLDDDSPVRGLIAQQVRETFPEYVTVRDKLRFNDTEFELEDFHEVNKQAITIDLLASVQAIHRRFHEDVTHSVTISTPSLPLPQGEYSSLASANDQSGSVSIVSGDVYKDGDSGTVRISSGSIIGSRTAGTAGDIEISVGTSKGDRVTGGDLNLRGGDAVGRGTIGGDILLQSGTGEQYSGDIDIICAVHPEFNLKKPHQW